MTDYEPEWNKFATIKNPEDIKIKKFFEKVNELNSKGIKCSCDNDEATPEGYCTNCFLRMESKKIKWIYGYPNSKNKRWLCYPPDFYRKMIEYKGSNGITGAEVMASTRGKLWELMRWYTYEKQQGKCGDCGEVFEEDEMELHHLIEKAYGGHEDEENLQMLCKACHRLHAISGWDLNDYSLKGGKR